MMFGGGDFTVISSEGWCILRTSGGRTLPLANSLAQSGFEVWTPKRVTKRPAPGQARRLVMGRRRKMIEIETAILPGFVFARAHQLDDLARIADAAEIGPYPDFSIFKFGGRAPIVGDSSVQGLRDAETDARAVLRSERDAETRDETRQNRAHQLRTLRARARAMKRECKTFDPGQDVVIADMPSMAGMTGKVVSEKSGAFMIDFGGALPMKVEAWRVIPVVVDDVRAVA
jgi:hypothetical protein